MKSLHLFALSCVLSSAALISSPAFAHAVLKSSIPAAGASVDAAPKQITLSFNEKLEEAFSSVSLKDASGKDVATGKVQMDAANPATLRLDLPALSTGAYSVQWVAVGHDGHRRLGDFTFTVK